VDGKPPYFKKIDKTLLDEMLHLFEADEVDAGGSDTASNLYRGFISITIHDDVDYAKTNHL